MKADEQIRLFVDDKRQVPEGWTQAKTSQEAIRILSQGNVIECSLDHDLGSDDTGYKVVCWMEENNVWPCDGVHCHSQNPVGKERIQAVIDKHSIDIAYPRMIKTPCSQFIPPGLV